MVDKARFKANEIDLTVKIQRGGFIKPHEMDVIIELGKKALFQAGVTSGRVINNFYNQGSQDQLGHMTIEPMDGEHAWKGKIHVYRDGRWTQGPGGLNAHGDGQVEMR